MKSKKKKLVSGLAIVLIVFSVLLIAASLTVNLLFKNTQSTPHLMGYDIFLNTETQMEPVVHQDAAVRITQPGLYAVGDVVVYQAATGSLHVSRIARLDNASTDTAQTLDVINTLGQTEALTIDAVKGRCVDENVTLGKILLFATSKLGIILLLVLPCVFLLIYAISRFIAAAQDDDDDEPVPEEGAVGMGRGHHSKSPLFTPEEASRKDKEFEEKKASLAEHFKQKSGDTMKMPRQKRKDKLDVEEGKRAMDEAAAARRKEKAAEAPKKAESGSEVDARVAAIRQAMEQRAQERRKQEEEEAQAIAASKARAARQSAEAAEEQPVVKRAPQPTEAPARPARRPEPEAPVRKPAEQPKPVAAKPAPRPEAKPRPQAKRPAARPAAGPTSFEELMAKLDEEKNKLNGSR